MVATNKFTQREAWLLQMVVANPRLSQKQLADLLGLSERGVRYLTDKLQKQGVLQRQGGKKMGQWIVAIHLLKNP
jgi:ATP-dependent DNA helicase RecG